MRCQNSSSSLATADLQAEPAGRGSRRPFDVRVPLPDPALRAELRDFFHRWGCLTYDVNDDAIEVVVPDAADERQGRRELRLYLETWRAHHPAPELELLDWRREP